MRLYYADAELKAISSELDSFDGKKDPIRCNLLVNQLRTAQDKVISLLFQLMDDCNCERASRDYRMKFPDEILLSEGSESLNGQIWFGAECLSAGSNILNHTKESTQLRPMAKTLTTHLDSLRNDLRDLVIDNLGAARIGQALIKKMVAFDHIFANFEYEYVKTMLPIRTVAEIEKLQEVAVLFSETLIDCVKRGLVKQDDIDEFQPIVMIAIPRLAIVRGLLYKNENPIYTRHKSQMCSLFQPFHGPLHSIRKLLRGLNPQELITLEKMLANDQSASESTPLRPDPQDNDEDTIRQASEKSPTISNDGGCGGYTEEPSTSNTYSNILMDGLQYPVGQKRDSQDFDDDYNPGEQPTSYNNCCFENQASSSKSIVAPATSSHNHDHQPQHDNSPVGSSSSPSSSTSSPGGECTHCTNSKSDGSNPNTINIGNRHCEQECCTSPPESDAQLDKLIAELGPATEQSVNLNEMEPETATSSGITIHQAATQEQTDISSKSQQDLAAAAAKDEVLEELFLQQARQLLHRLFVAISGVADQLQSNFASDLRFILRQIFNTDETEEDEDEGGSIDNLSNDQSDSSLPIEQGIEAHEIQAVANLIDLESGYSVENTYDYNRDMHLVPSASDHGNPTQPFYSHNQENEANNQYSMNEPSYLTDLEQNQRISDSSERHNHNIRNQSRSIRLDRVDEEQLHSQAIADLLRRSSDPLDGLNLYESRISPNDASIMEDEMHRRQLLQQHLESLSRVRSSSSRGSRNMQNSDSNGIYQQQQPLPQPLNIERRSRSHRHGSRSRRPRGPPVWVPDQLVIACSCCNASFTLFRRRHHCRACGQIFCSDCSRFTKDLNCWGYNGPVRVCESCYNQP